MSGKGSSPRPFSVDKTTFATNWDKAFGKKTEKFDQNHNKEKKDEHPNCGTAECCGECNE